MFSNYLKRVGLGEFVPDSRKVILNDFVKQAFEKSHDFFSKQEIETLLSYDVPKLGPNGSCSISKEKEERKYQLNEILGLPFDFKLLTDHPETFRIWRLSEVVDVLYKTIGVDWIGIYRKVNKRHGLEVLVKEAYRGAYSRAEFPLTKEFVKTSNNSTVGLTGKAIYFQDLATYNGPYYECDKQVQSEYCGPILDTRGNVIGIIDAESFKKNFFTPERIVQLTKICRDLGRIRLGKKNWHV